MTAFAPAAPAVAATLPVPSCWGRSIAPYDDPRALPGHFTALQVTDEDGALHADLADDAATPLRSAGHGAGGSCL